MATSKAVAVNTTHSVTGVFSFQWANASFAETYVVMKSIEALKKFREKTQEPRIARRGTDKAKGKSEKRKNHG